MPIANTFFKSADLLIFLTDCRLNLDLQNKQKSADVTNQSIIILLNNILPSHVGQFAKNIAPRSLVSQFLVLFRSRGISQLYSQTRTLL